MSTQIDTSTDGGVGAPFGDMTATPSTAALFAAPSDDMLVALYFGSTGPTLANAASPYTSWTTQGIGSATTRNSQAMTENGSGDNLNLIVSSPGLGPYQFLANRSGASYSVPGVGQTGDPNNAGLSGQGAAMWVGYDPFGRLWYVGVDDVNATYVLASGYYNGSSWTFTNTLDSQALGEQNHYGACAAIVGNYLVVVYDSGSGHLSYRRQDVSGATLSGFSAAAQVGTLADVTTASTLSLRTIPGGSTAMLAYSGTNGISALTYDASTNTWGTVHNLSSSTSDKHCSLITGGSGVVYAVWAQFAAANSYAIVGNIYNGSWNGSPTALEASGNNIAWPNGAYLATGTKLALVWTQGTASPWSVEFDSVAAPTSGGGTVQGGGTLTSNSALDQTSATVLGGGTMQSNSVLEGPGVHPGGTLQSNSGLSVTATIVAHNQLLQSNSVLVGIPFTPAVIRSVVAWGVDGTVLATPY
jgi:hypothetical protein